MFRNYRNRGYRGKRPVTPPLDKGCYVMPTVFKDVTQNMTIARQEIFGPVACIMKFSTEDEVIAKANDNTFGLCASVWTKNVARGIKIANRIQAGTVWVNDHGALATEMPWGGFKESGFGKESSVIGLDSYTQIKAVSIDLDDMKRFPPGGPGGRNPGSAGPPLGKPPVT